MITNDQKSPELTFRSDRVAPWGWFFASIADAINIESPSRQNFTIKLVLGEFSTSNAIADGEAEVGMTTPPACVTMAYRGVGPYTKKMPNLRAIGSLPHDDRMVWAVPADSGINSIEDMKDRPLRLALPGADFPVRFAVERILELYGLPLPELIRRGWQVVEESHCLKIPLVVLEGRADAVVHEARLTPAWRQLTEKRRMRFLPIREDILDTLEREYGYRKAVLSRGMLRGVEKDTPCVDFSDWMLFVRDDMPDDLAYLITKIFVEKKGECFERFFASTPADRREMTVPIDPKQVWRNVGGIPLHPGAEKYYKDHGYM